MHAARLTHTLCCMCCCMCAVYVAFCFCFFSLARPANSHILPFRLARAAKLTMVQNIACGNCQVPLLHAQLASCTDCSRHFCHGCCIESRCCMQSLYQHQLPQPTASGAASEPLPAPVAVRAAEAVVQYTAYAKCEVPFVHKQLVACTTCSRHICHGCCIASGCCMQSLYRQSCSTRME